MQVKLILTVMFCVLYSSCLRADYDADDLQKLFTDKNQRAQIDAMRSGNYSGAEQKSSKVRMSGYMTRSDGKSVVWVNNKNTLDSSKLGDIKVQQLNVGENKKVGVTVEGEHVHLKPGETWHKETGKIVDNQ